MAFVVLNYHFNLRKIFRDLERNGIQNAICPPGVKFDCYDLCPDFNNFIYCTTGVNNKKNDEIHPYKDWKISWDQMKVTICETQKQNAIQRAAKDNDTFVNSTILNSEIIFIVPMVFIGAYFSQRIRKTDWGRIHLQPAEPCSKLSYVHFA